MSKKSKKKEKAICTITEFSYIRSPCEVQVSFQLLYPAWCRLEKSKEWNRFLEVLAPYQKKK